MSGDPGSPMEDDRGNLVQLDPETREFVGLMIVDFKDWDGQEIEFQVPEPHRVRPLQPV